MTNQSFESWLVGLDRLAVEQWSQLQQAVQERSKGVVAVAATRAFRWRHRFLHQARQLAGLVEADATYVSHIHKGARKPQWKVRRRDGRACKRGLSREQVPVLLVTAPGGATAGQVLETVSQASLEAALAPVLASDGCRAYPGSARVLAGQHEAVNVSADKRVSGSYHIRSVNSRHYQWNAFLEPFRAAATKYLDSYLRWFQQVGLVRQVSPGSCLVASMTPKCIRFANRTKDVRGSGGLACLRSPITPKARIMYYLLCSKAARQDHALIGRRSDERRRVAQRVRSGSSTSRRGSVENRAVIGLK